MDHAAIVTELIKKPPLTTISILLAVNGSKHAIHVRMIVYVIISIFARNVRAFHMEYFTNQIIALIVSNITGFKKEISAK